MLVLINMLANFQTLVWCLIHTAHLKFGSKEQSYKAADEKIQYLEAEMERRVNDEVRNYASVTVVV